MGSSGSKSNLLNKKSKSLLINKANNCLCILLNKLNQGHLSHFMKNIGMNLGIKLAIRKNEFRMR